jgi:hypothetical protein
MSEPKHENESGLIIDSSLLAQIREACQRRRAELETTGELQRLPIAPGSPQVAFGELPIALPVSEAERFAAAVSEMPPRVRAFFESEEPPYIPPHRQESEAQRLEREQRASFGGWPGG